MAGLLVVEPLEFVKTVSYSLPLCAVVVAGRESVVDVAPAMGLHVVPPSVETCHCTVGAGVPEAAAVNEAGWPAITD